MGLKKVLIVEVAQKVDDAADEGKEQKKVPRYERPDCEGFKHGPGACSKPLRRYVLKRKRRPEN